MGSDENSCMRRIIQPSGNGDLTPIPGSFAPLALAQIEGVAWIHREVGKARLLHLVGGGDRQFGEEGDMPRRLEVGETIQAPALDGEWRLAVRWDVWREHHAGHDFLVAHAVGSGYHGSLSPRRMAGQSGF